MSDVLASRRYRGLAVGSVIDEVHTDLDELWTDAPFVQEMDQMTFTTAVIESVSNIVQHAEPEGRGPVELSVHVEVRTTQLKAEISAYHAKPPLGMMNPHMPGEDAESGRGLALIEALVTTVTFERQDATNTWVLSRTPQS
ncbi:serine/threonine-protein kinase RsbW [Arthrobacter sp. CAN_A212]|uniref:ATP-binding protein n=1 Tax=unclassified Arthrobacter TaxID=235627 RepID=UPI0018C929F0|nr:ATP-binding protein [Arthrobacter sp. CAN_C5]MBP2218340.1 serine/threonine-protein kinase RsbW [Arthrobacter sp. CAN_C5]